MSLFDPPSPEEPSGPKHGLHGGPEDLRLANELVAEERWRDALDVLESILGLPEEAHAAFSRLQRLLGESTPLKIASAYQVRTTDGSHLVRSRMDLGGSLIRDLMAMRGQCLWHLILEMVERHEFDMRAVAADPKFDALFGGPPRDRPADSSRSR